MKLVLMKMGKCLSVFLLFNYLFLVICYSFLLY